MKGYRCKCGAKILSEAVLCAKCMQEFEDRHAHDRHWQLHGTNSPMGRLVRHRMAMDKRWYWLLELATAASFLLTGLVLAPVAHHAAPLWLSAALAIFVAVVMALFVIALRKFLDEHTEITRQIFEQIDQQLFDEKSQP